MYNKELKMLQDIMDIQDYKRFNMRLYERNTGKFITNCKAYFLKNKLKLEFNSFAMVANNKSFDKEANTLTIYGEDFNRQLFLAEIPVKNYEFEDIQSVDIPNLCIVPTMEFDLRDTSQYIIIRAEGIILAQECEKVFFTINKK